MTSAPSSSDIWDSKSHQLLDRVKAGAPEAWRRFNAVYGPVVYGWCRQSGVPEHDAADVVQDVFRAVLTHVANFRSQGQKSFRSWLRTITRNKVIDFFRIHARRAQASGDSHVLEVLKQVPFDDSAAVDESTDQHEFAHRVLMLIQEEFEASTWRAFWLCTVEGRSSAHVAEELRLSTGAVRQAKYRVLRRLREALGDVL